MNVKSARNYITLLHFVLLIFSCQNAAKDTQEASAMLTAPAEWYISEISVNDAVTFRDGKMKPQFGGLDFGRHMETVQFKPGGVFSGLFKDSSNPMILKWKLDADKIVLGAADSTSKAGEWTVSPKDVFEDSFTMRTESMAYDFPRMTKIAMKFKTAR